MDNEYFGVATTPTSDYLAHYGIKGMKWGVRKARESGNMKALGRQYRKAEKKLAKLERQAASGKKYAKRAALMGAGAAAAGGVAATGTRGIAAVTKGAGRVAGDITSGAGNLALRASNVMRKAGIRGSSKVAAAGTSMYRAGRSVRGATAGASRAVDTWGKGNSVGNKVGRAVGNVKAPSIVNQTLAKTTGTNIAGYGEKLKRVSNSGYTRLAGAGMAAGLGAGAAYNAYRAATTKRAARKAAEFRKEMNKQFAGTQYASGGTRKRRRR